MGKAGAYINFANMQRKINGTGNSDNFPNTVYEDAGDPLLYSFATNLPGIGPGPGVNQVSSRYRGKQNASVYAAFLESKLFTQYNVNPHLSFRLSWDQFLINGLAMAPYQLHFRAGAIKN